jgi:uncharacterized protein involved in response to NO
MTWHLKQQFHQQIVGLVVVVFVNSLTPPPPPKTTPLQNLFAQPHRVFFFFGVLFGVVFIAVLALHYLGIISLHVEIHLYHAYAYMYIVFTQFFAGFLLTTFPRYLSMPSPDKERYAPVVYLINLGAILFIISSFLSDMLVVFSMVIITFGYGKLFMIFYEMHQKSKVTNKQDTTWILLAFAFGFIGQILFTCSLFLPTYALALELGFYLYLFFIVLVISQKMIPFFSANNVQNYKINKSKYFLHVIFVLLVLKALFVFLNINLLFLHVGLFGVLLGELIRWKLPYTKAPAILWVLFLALWWMPVGFGLFMIEDILNLLGYNVYLEKAPLHALAIGYFTTMLVGFGTRVILGHSGRIPKADRYALILIFLIQFMTVMRIFAGIFPQWGYLHAIVTAGFLWILVFSLWSKRYLLILFEK